MIDESVHSHFAPRERPPAWLRGTCFALGTVIPIATAVFAVWSELSSAHWDWTGFLPALCAIACLFAIPLGIVALTGVSACFYDDPDASTFVAVMTGLFAFLAAMPVFCELTGLDTMHLSNTEILAVAVVAYYLLTTCLLHARLAWLSPRPSPFDL